MHITMHWDCPWERNECGYETITYAQDGKVALCFCQGEREDRTFHRDFKHCAALLPLLEAAHAAGLRGEAFTSNVLCTPTAQDLVDLGVA